MNRHLARQILAFGTLAGFLGVSAIALLNVEMPKFDLIFGAWVGLVTKVMSDYFGDNSGEPGGPSDG